VTDGVTSSAEDNEEFERAGRALAKRAEDLDLRLKRHDATKPQQAFSTRAQRRDVARWMKKYEELKAEYERYLHDLAEFREQHKNFYADPGASD
jgi:hypothetical protein